MWAIYHVSFSFACSSPANTLLVASVDELAMYEFHCRNENSILYALCAWELKFHQLPLLDQKPGIKLPAINGDLGVIARGFVHHSEEFIYLGVFNLEEIIPSPTPTFIPTYLPTNSPTFFAN